MVQHLRFDLGTLSKGATVIVSLKNQANVQLMTTSEYNNYKAGRRYTYHGGRVTRSPFRIAVPRSGHWVAAIDLGGLQGRIEASVQVEPPARGFLPQARQPRETPAANVVVRDEPQEPIGNAFGGQTWDVFISHASEDKDAVARPLRSALIKRGISVWLDESQMQLGSSLRRKIDEGIRASRYGIVILSPDFLAKGWTNHELDGLISRTVAGEQSLLPIWHGLGAQEVRDYSPSLADKVALSTADTTLDEIADQIAAVIDGDH